MKDVIDCPNCGGQLIKDDAYSLEDLYLCDCCGLRLEDGKYIREDGSEGNSK